ncbi:ribosome assembly protein 4 (RSA4) [Metarhizium guizhouense ARSEF 977]|uniref:Ribosome assembly protein 4 (RSA4) n=1 Tax=Metarhizium guizhouense (strain ARSEF 977) TaxID=1276136 RepID=A0A0B4GTW7_METGA|nr:ribosome assembly protein 4 (RSA4) [Metarhizium guizhouense ARSEF 977]
MYRALFSTKEYEFFQGWDSTTEPENQLLWVRGETGVGKTMLLTGTVRALLPATAQDKSDPCFLSFYFFDHAKKGSNNAASALRTIIWLILVYQPDLCTHLTRKLDSTRRRHLNDPNDFLALSAIFYDMIEDERIAKTYIVVDVLDQCMSCNGQPGVDDVLALITKSLKLSKRIKWLVSSDESERFKSTFLNIGCRHVDLSQGLLGMDVAMHDYIAAKVRDLARTNKYDEELEEEVIRELHSASQGN